MSCCDEREPESREESVCLVEREGQVSIAELHELLLRAHSVQPQWWIDARGDDDLQRVRATVDELPEHLGALTSCEVKVVDANDSATGEPIEVVGKRRDGVDRDGALGVHQLERVRAEARFIEAELQRADECRHEPNREAVRDVAAEPGRASIGLAREPIRKERRLAGAGRTHDQRQAKVRSAVQLVEQPRP